MFDKIFEFKYETIAILGAIITISLVFWFLSKVKKVKFDTRMIVYGGLSMSLAFVLSYIKLFSMPQGGTITPASMLPLIIFAMMFGPIPGIIVGVAYGFLQLMQDGYVVHWAQLILDYPLAFGVIGFAGIFKKNIIPACLTGGLLRLLCHFLSGFIFFSEYAGDQNPILYSLIYNGSFMGVDIAICVVVAVLIFSTLKQSVFRQSITN